MNVTNVAQILALFGAPGSGKSHEMKRQLDLRRPDRLIVIDPDGEYAPYGQMYATATGLYAGTLAPKFRVRLATAHDRAKAIAQFDVVCRIIRWQVDPQPGQIKPPSIAPVTLAVDELADFVGASYRESPESWQWILRRGRKYGVSVIAASQRPAQIDKTLFDCASLIRTGRLNYGDSIDTLAKAIGVDKADLMRLQNHDFIERDKNTGQLRRHITGEPDGALQEAKPTPKAAKKAKSRPIDRPKTARRPIRAGR